MFRWLFTLLLEMSSFEHTQKRSNNPKMRTERKLRDSGAMRWQFNNVRWFFNLKLNQLRYLLLREQQCFFFFINILSSVCSLWTQCEPFEHTIDLNFVITIWNGWVLHKYSIYIENACIRLATGTWQKLYGWTKDGSRRKITACLQINIKCLNKPYCCSAFDVWPPTASLTHTHTLAPKPKPKHGSSVLTLLWSTLTVPTHFYCQMISVPNVFVICMFMESLSWIIICWKSWTAVNGSGNRLKANGKRKDFEWFEN